MRLAFRLVLMSAILVLTFNVFAQETDAVGCKDSPIITRMPGSTIHSCENKEYDQAKMPADADGAEKK